MSRVLNQTGQALIEVTIASGLAVVIISAIAITTIIGLRNSQFAQNQIQATKFAQEGIEQVRNVQNRNCPLIDSTTYYYWYDDQTISPPPANFVWLNLASLASLNFQVQVDATHCQLNSNPLPEKLLNSRFIRTISLDAVTGVSNKAKATVTVVWTDYSGSHQSQLVTILSKD